MSVSLGMVATPVVRRFKLHRAKAVPVICGATIAVVLFLALFGPLLAPYDPASVDLAYAYVGPTEGHPLGFDSQGRDLLSRLLAGARTAILGPVAITVLSVTAGTVLGVTAAWVGGWTDTGISAIVDLIFSFPGLLLAILAAALFGPGIVTPIVALAIAYTPYLARVIRSAALRERAKDYIAAAELQGMSGLVVSFRHLFPNIAPVLVAQGTLVFGYSIADFAAISYLGLGVQPPATDWGIMVAEGQLGILIGYPMESLSAGALIVMTVVSVNILGERMLETKESAS
jgi:peptide/nickel transport system permease protein